MAKKTLRIDPLRERHGLYLQRSFVLALLLMIAFFAAFKRFESEGPEELPVVTLNVVVEPVPATRQGARRPPPAKPVVPVEGEEEIPPEDEEIDLSLFEDTGEQVSSGQSQSLGGSLLYLPRTVRDVIPEFPEKLRGKVKGLVKLMLLVDPTGRVKQVLVVQNTTSSDELEKAAVEAAKRCLFAPPRDSRGRPVSVWVPKTYLFE